MAIPLGSSSDAPVISPGPRASSSRGLLVETTALGGVRAVFLLEAILGVPSNINENNRVIKTRVRVAGSLVQDFEDRKLPRELPSDFGGAKRRFMVCRRLRKGSSGVLRVSKIQRIVFVVGLLALIAMSATLVGIVLYRAFPDSHWVTLAGPLGAIGAVIALRRVFSE